MVGGVIKKKPDVFIEVCLYKEWRQPKQPCVVPKGKKESLFKKWTSPPVVDPPVSRLNRATMILVEDSHIL